jgi:type IX secretion system PorP/SprF family membrane protein
LLAAVITTAATAFNASAQVDAGFTNYFETPSYYNPGAIGLNDYLRIRGGSRLQWVGIPKAPKTFLGNADMPVKLFNKRIGVGLVMQQESMGLYNNLTIGAMGAYKVKLLKGELSIGVRVGLFDESFKGSEVVLPDDDDYHQSADDAIPTSDIHGTAFDASVGAYYTHRLFWLGISATHINQPTVTMSADGSESKQYEFEAGRCFYFMAGCNIPIKNTLFELQPSMLLKSDFTFTTAEVTARLRYNRFIYGGLSYRYDDAISLLIGANYKEFFFGYSYDYPTTYISKASSGSHELWIGYSMKLDLGEKNKHRHKSIRLM